METVKISESFLNENIADITKLKKQYISNIIDLGDTILIKTPNFELRVLKTDIKQIKQFEVYPKVLESNIFDFEGYQIFDRIIQKSPKISDFNAFIYFPKINYSFGCETDLRNNGILKHVSNVDFSYKNITSNIDKRDFFTYIINSVKGLNDININELNKICAVFCNNVWENATYKPNDIFSSYTVKENKFGFLFSDKITHRYYELKAGQNFI